ncbi:virion transmembrane glycoprotein [Obodhiang virus]|uniref:Virion transmembrane glycoprotein n=1 Tax=Obodhiang virus TaxID=380160 RepID=H8XWS8_9RHAB|nr:virion transmembrane glycoprotein [Obodhiang virus]AEI17644.1 virion transmembrane glycoprotein [Obodhiang virus]
MALFPVTIAITYMSLINSAICEKYVTIPINCNGEVEINKMDVMCPNRYNVLSTNHLFKGEEVETFCRPSLRENDLLDGYLCRKQKWEVTCTETWYFVTDVQYQIIEEVPTVTECLEEKERKLQGEYIPPYYPPTNCIWNAVDKQYRTFIILIEHPVIEDPISMKLMDSKFNKPCDPVHGKVTTCDTYNPLVKWVSKETNGYSLHCQIKSWECIPVKLHHSYEDVLDKLYLESPDFGVVDASKICNMSFCGHEGILLENGEWWSIYRSGFTNGYLQNHKSINNRIESCSDRKPGYKLTKLDTTYMDLEFEIELEHEKCLGTLEKLQNGEYVTPLDLSYLSPSNPGTNYAYRFEYKNKTVDKCVQLEYTYEAGDCKIMFDGREGHGAYYNWTTIKLDKIKRAVCEYHTFSFDLKNKKHTYSDKDDPRIQINKTFVETVLKSTPLIGRNEEHEGNMSWNGIIIEQAKDSEEINVIVPSTSQYNHIVIKKLLRKLDMVDYYGYKFDSLSGSVSYNEIKPILRSENVQNAERVDVIKYIKEKGSYIINGFTGWFSSLGKMVRWTIWGIGLIFSLFTLYKIITLLRKHSNLNKKEKEGQAKSTIMTNNNSSETNDFKESIIISDHPKGVARKLFDYFSKKSGKRQNIYRQATSDSTGGTYEEIHFFNV